MRECKNYCILCKIYYEIIRYNMLIVCILDDRIILFLFINQSGWHYFNEIARKLLNNVI